MAAPHVAGLAALVLARHPGFSTEEVRQAIRVSAVDIGRPGPDEESGYGRVDAARAVEVERALAARILDPPDGATVRGTVAVSGLAGRTGPRALRAGGGRGREPRRLDDAGRGVLALGGRVLGSFDAGAVPDGLYTLRLTATDDSGRAFDDRRQVIVDEVRFDAPPPPRSPASATVVRPGLPVALEGRADGPSFARYRLLWAPGLHPPSGWTEDGLALESGGLRPVDGGRLATWEPPLDARAGYHSFRLLVDNERASRARRAPLLYLEPDLLSGHWPQPLRPGPWKGVGAHAVTGAAGEPLLALTSPLDAGGTRLWRFDAYWLLRRRHRRRGASRPRRAPPDRHRPSRRRGRATRSSSRTRASSGRGARTARRGPSPPRRGTASCARCR